MSTSSTSSSRYLKEQTDWQRYREAIASKLIREGVPPSEARSRAQKEAERQEGLRRQQLEAAKVKREAAKKYRKQA